MTIGDHPDYLAIGFLLNQKMLLLDDKIEKIEYDEDLQTIVIRTLRKTSYEKKLQQKTRTSGCAVGTVFGDMLEGLDDVKLSKNKVKTSWIYALAKKINTTPSLYLSAGAIHGTVLCEKSTPLIYMEDVGRHNAVDKVSGWMFINKIKSSDKILYTTGRLTSEMIIKSALMGIPTLISRSGFTAWGVEIANKLGMTLIGRLRGRRFICLSGEKRLVRDVDPKVISDENPKDNRKAGND
jgi:FdhD protein